MTPSSARADHLETVAGKVPAVTFGFRTIRIQVATLGDSGGDTLGMRINLGHVAATGIFAANDDGDVADALRRAAAMREETRVGVATSPVPFAARQATAGTWLPVTRRDAPTAAGPDRAPLRRIPSATTSHGHHGAPRR